MRCALVPSPYICVCDCTSRLQFSTPNTDPVDAVLVCKGDVLKNKNVKMLFFARISAQLQEVQIYRKCKEHEKLKTVAKYAVLMAYKAANSCINTIENILEDVNTQTQIIATRYNFGTLQLICSPVGTVVASDFLSMKTQLHLLMTCRCFKNWISQKHRRLVSMIGPVRTIQLDLTRFSTWKKLQYETMLKTSLLPDEQWYAVHRHSCFGSSAQQMSTFYHSMYEKDNPQLISSIPPDVFSRYFRMPIPSRVNSNVVIVQINGISDPAISFHMSQRGSTIADVKNMILPRLKHWIVKGITPGRIHLEFHGQMDIGDCRVLSDFARHPGTVTFYCTLH